MKAQAQNLTTDINVTPFLDILLVLIITFLAAISARKSMDVVLPVPCEGTCESKNVPIVLEILAVSWRDCYFHSAER
ncbi:MAG: biopolymer transporter ExbD [bacterium]